jgi:hypothetical protein
LRLLDAARQLMLRDVRLLPREHHHGDECLIGLCVEGSHQGRASS